MKQIIITSKLFGCLSFASEDGIMENFQIAINDKNLLIELYIMEDFITESNLNQVLLFLENIPNMYEMAKSFIASNIDDNEVESYFLESLMDGIDKDDLINILDICTHKKITKSLVAQKLEPRAIRIAPGKAEDVDFNFDFSLPEEYSDELLVVYFNKYYEIHEISHES